LVETKGAIAVDPIAARHHLLRLISYAAVFWIAMRAADDRRRARRLVMAIALFSTALAIYGLATAVVGWNPITAVAGGSAGPVTASFVNRNSYATYAAFGLLANLAAWILVMEDERMDDAAKTTRQFVRDLLASLGRRGWPFAVGALICGLAIAAGQSRAGAGAAVIGVLALFVARGRGGGSSARVAFAGVALGIVIVVATSAGGLTERLLTTSGEDARFLAYPRILDAIAERPWLGYGLGGFEDGFRAHVPLAAATAEWDLAHSSYLENIFELGVAAAAVFYAVLLLIVVRLARGVAERRRDRILPAFALACAAVAGVHSLVDFSLQMPASAALFAFVLGLGWTQSFRSYSARGPRSGRVDASSPVGRVATS
jgi:O-antigen ligase